MTAMLVFPVDICCCLDKNININSQKHNIYESLGNLNVPKHLEEKPHFPSAALWLSLALSWKSIEFSNVQIYSICYSFSLHRHMNLCFKAFYFFTAFGGLHFGIVVTFSVTNIDCSSKYRHFALQSLKKPNLSVYTSCFYNYLPISTGKRKGKCM